MEKYGFIGGGQMAESLIAGLVTSKLTSASSIYVSDTSNATLSKLKSKYNINICESNNEVVQNTNIIILATKPYVIPSICKEMYNLDLNNKLIISIAAGVTIEKIQSSLPKNTKVVRVMPNTPALIGLGAAGYSLGKSCDNKLDDAIVLKLLSCVGIAYSVEENLLDAVCGLSGSGPAYAYMVIEALADGGVFSGLPRQMAIKLAAQTVYGAAAMVLKGDQHTAQLKDAVCSPGGTTAQGLLALEKGKLRHALIDAVMKATKKSVELGKPQSKL